MENIYSLIVLYPSSNKWKTVQEFKVEVKANSLVFRDGCHSFYTDGDLVAVYPSNYTIIQKIVYNE